MAAILLLEDGGGAVYPRKKREGHASRGNKYGVPRRLDLSIPVGMLGWTLVALAAAMPLVVGLYWGPKDIAKSFGDVLLKVTITAALVMVVGWPFVRRRSATAKAVRTLIAGVLTICISGSVLLPLKARLEEQETALKDLDATTTQDATLLTASGPQRQFKDQGAQLIQGADALVRKGLSEIGALMRQIDAIDLSQVLLLPANATDKAVQENRLKLKVYGAHLEEVAQKLEALEGEALSYLQKMPNEQMRVAALQGYRESQPVPMSLFRDYMRASVADLEAMGRIVDFYATRREHLYMRGDELMIPRAQDRQDFQKLLAERNATDARAQDLQDQIDKLRMARQPTSAGRK
jgi:hypothetical protein